MTGRRHRGGAVAVLAAAALVTACSSGPFVEVEDAYESTGPLTPDGQASFPDAAPDVDPGDVPGPPGDEVPQTTIDWGECGSYGIPDRVTSLTRGWECGRLVVDMDPYDATPDLPDVDLAVTRHRATGQRLGTIVVNPGGPGAAGLPIAWSIRGGLPTSLLRGFDVVSWDPRGIGRSTPRADCSGADSSDDDFIATCVEATGPLSGFLSAPYSAADMEALRVALGEPELNYLGFSYGSILGATYAERWPSTVGAFVLDGVTDPDAGSIDGPFEDGFAVFADDGRPEAFDRLVELCASTERCLPGSDPRAVIDELRTTVEDLPTDDFAGRPDVVDPSAFDLYIDTSLGYAGDWELLATALEDADAGDASALAAAIDDGASSPSDDDGGGQGPGVDVDNFSDANFMIYCADFATLITQWSFCDDMPVSAHPLQAVEEIDVERPVLVIGTEFDPLTPGRHAPEFVDALVDATHIIWEGVGHTAFPGWTDCIDDAVAAQFLDDALPADGTRCSMVEGVSDDTELADSLFGFDPIEATNWIADALAGRDDTRGDPDCLASGIVPVDPAAVDDRVVSHLVLDVTSPEAEVSLAAAAARC